MSSKGDTLGRVGQVRRKPFQGSIPDAEVMAKAVKKCGVGNKIESNRAIKQGKYRFF